MRFPFLRHCCIAAAASLATLSAMPLAAQERGAPARDIVPRASRADAGGRSLSDAIRRVQRTTGGQILGAERVPFDGRSINRVKYLDDRGRVRYMDDPGPERSDPRAQLGPDAPSPRGDNP